MPNWEKWLCCAASLFPHLQKLSIRRYPKLTGKIMIMSPLPAPLFKPQNLKFQACLSGSIFKCYWDHNNIISSQSGSLWFCGISTRGGQHTWPGNRDCSFSRSLHKVGLPTTSLKWLSTSKCSKLEYLLPKLFRCHLPVIERLSIGGVMGDSCSSLSLSLCVFPNYVEWIQDQWSQGAWKALHFNFIFGGWWYTDTGLSSLRSLNLSGSPDLESLSNCTLSIWSPVTSMIAPSSGLGARAHTYSSVQKLYLVRCPELMFQREICLPNHVSL